MPTLRIDLPAQIHPRLPPIDPASTEEPQHGSLVWGCAGGGTPEDPRRAALCAEWTTDGGRIRASVHGQSGIEVRLGQRGAAPLTPGPNGWIQWIPEGTFWVTFPAEPGKGWEPLTLRVVV